MTNIPEIVSQQEIDQLLHTSTISPIEEPQECMKKKLAKIIENNMSAHQPITTQCSTVTALWEDISKLLNWK